MKNQDMIVLALAGIAVYMILKSKPTAAGTRVQSTDLVTEILDSFGNGFENGWQYFSDGTSISPDGKYYQGDKLIWTPGTGGASGSW